MVRSPVTILFFLFVLVAFLLTDGALASAPAAEQTIDARITALISERFPGARVEIRGVQLPPGAQVDASGIEWLRDDARGVAYFRSGAIEFGAEYSAWKKTFVAVRRVRPGERLDRAFFELREVDVSRGQAREYRGLMLDEAANIEGYEADQTILEGHFPLLSGVRETPDVRRGEMVKLRLVSGGLVLSTHAMASEAGNLGKPLRVLTLSTKRQLTGTLQADNTVEVSL